MTAVTWTKVAETYQRLCASNKCTMPAVWRMEAGNVTSDYCDECRSQIEAHLSGRPDEEDEEERDYRLREMEHLDREGQL